MKYSIALFVLVVSGCAEQPEAIWKNPSLDASRERQQFAIDSDQCWEIAASSVPAPKLYPPLQSASPQANNLPGAGMPGAGEARSANYNSQQIVDAQRAKSNAFDRCMEERGWQR